CDFYFVSPGAMPAVASSEPAPSKTASSVPGASLTTPPPAASRPAAPPPSPPPQQAQVEASAPPPTPAPAPAKTSERVVRKEPTQIAMLAPPPQNKPAAPPAQTKSAPPRVIAPAPPPAHEVAVKNNAAGEELFRKGVEAQKKGQVALAADLYGQAADTGHAGAQYELGLLYKIGRRP